MSEGLEAVINQAISDSGVDTGGGDSGVDTSVDTSAVDTTTVVDANVNTSAQVAEPDEIDQLLAAGGVKPPVEGQRENRLPYSRTRKIIENARKKWQAEVDKANTTLKTEHSTYKQRVEAWESAEKLAASDPEKYLRTLATLNPAYQRFLQPLTAAVKDQQHQTQEATFNEPEPKPEKLADGTTGYTEEGFRKLLDWRSRKTAFEVENKIRKEYDQKYGPTLESIQKENMARATMEARRPVVRAQIARINETYGAELVKQHEAEIIKAMQVDEHLTMDAAAAQVLIPKMRQDKTVMREEILKELKERPNAAAGNTPAARKTTPDPTPSGDSTENAIWQSLRAAGAVA